MTSRCGHSTLPTAFALPSDFMNIVFIARGVHPGQRHEQAIISSGSQVRQLSRDHVLVSGPLFVTHPSWLTYLDVKYTHRKTWPLDDLFSESIAVGFCLVAYAFRPLPGRAAGRAGPRPVNLEAAARPGPAAQQLQVRKQPNATPAPPFIERSGIMGRRISASTGSRATRTGRS